MSLVNEINGGLLRKLSDTGGSSTPSAVPNSTVGGKGLGASFDASSIDLSIGLQRAATAFASSFGRINTGVSQLDIATATMEKIVSHVDRLVELSKRAEAVSLSDQERARLNSEFQRIVGEIERVRNDATAGTTDLLTVDDLKSVLTDSGIDLNKVSSVSTALKKLGGVEGRLGKEAVSIPELFATSAVGQGESGSDPLEQDISTQAGAERATAFLDEFQEIIVPELENLQRINTDLAAAARFALISADVFEQFIEKSSTINDPDTLASQIVSAVRGRTRDPALGAHSSLDSQLAAELLAE